nr:MAG: ORF1 [TTV-like mini virus]
MAYYNWRPYYNYRRRRWPRRRRIRKTFWRPRRWRRRVRRQFKLKKIRLEQWQPRSIRKCHIKGLECLCLFNQSRLAFNSIMYKESFVNPSYPGGGGFTVMKFTLSNLYDMHQKCYNWWTNSNDNLPLCRYMGCKIKCYASQNFDYIIKYNTSLPATSNKLTYPSTQPSMLMMSNNKRIIPSRKTRPRRKPYTIIKIKPPPKLENKWYYQKELKDIPLLVLYTAPTSLTQYYISSSSENNNITIHSLNPTLITNRNFQQPIWPHKVDGTNTYYLWEFTGIHLNENAIKAKELLPLTNIKNYTQGSSYIEAYATTHEDKHTEYCNNINQYTGNPFVKEHRENHTYIFFSKMGPTSFANAWKSKSLDELATNLTDEAGQKMTLTRIHEPLIKTYRYNPFRDDGSSTQMYLLKITETTHNTNTAWNPPDNLDVQLDGFPLWLNIWGFIDFQKRLGAYPQIDTKTILVFKSKALYPETTQPIIPIDWDYLNNKSPFEDSVNPQDTKNWNPQVQYQVATINDIAHTGPGTPKLYQKTSEQIVIKYDFYFKWGGDPAKMVNVENPSKQIVYPLPSDELKTTSLQSPAQAIETVLYSFDQRNDQLTKQALERISKDWDFTPILSSITEPTGAIKATSSFPQDPQTKTTEEKEKETLQLQLIQQHRRQQQLKLRIINLLKQLDT